MTTFLNVPGKSGALEWTVSNKSVWAETVYFHAHSHALGSVGLNFISFA